MVWSKTTNGVWASEPLCTINQTQHVQKVYSLTCAHHFNKYSNQKKMEKCAKVQIWTTTLYPNERITKTFLNLYFYDSLMHFSSSFHTYVSAKLNISCGPISTSTRPSLQCTTSHASYYIYRLPHSSPHIDWEIYIQLTDCRAYSTLSKTYQPNSHNIPPPRQNLFSCSSLVICSSASLLPTSNWGQEGSRGSFSTGKGRARVANPRPPRATCTKTGLGTGLRIMAPTVLRRRETERLMEIFSDRRNTLCKILSNSKVHYSTKPVMNPNTFVP